MDAEVSVRLLGRPAVESGGVRADALGGGKCAPLLCLVALAGGDGRSRDELADLLWPDADTLTGRNRLKQTLAVLRRALDAAGVDPDALLRADRQRIALAHDIRVDVAAFLHLLRCAARAQDDPARIAALEAATALAAEPLAQSLTDDPILLERERLFLLRIAALERLADTALAAGEVERAEDACRLLLEADPLHENGCLRWMRILSESGRGAEALRRYGALETALQQRLGVVPGEALRTLASSLRAAPLPAPAAPARPVATPVALTRFFGREAELDGLVALLDPDGVERSRLLTLTGPGGTGKTRLAQEALVRLKNGFSRTAFVPLAEVTAPGRIVGAAATALGLAWGSAGAAPALQAALKDSRSLLALDNFEQLVEGGAEVVRSLLAECPGLSLLVTSRQRLRLQGEREFVVRPLPLPDSVDLFVDRARLARPGFALTERNAPAVSALCRRLDGLPLALELAASRCSVLTPEQIGERLSARFDLLADRSPDRDGRHRSLRAALDWGWELLGNDERRFFVPLATFRGSFDLEAVEAVTGEPLALDFLELLRDRSFVVAEESGATMRYRLLETLREYAAEKGRGQEAAAGRHARHFLAWAEALRPGLDGAQQRETLAALDRDRENLLAALDWAQVHAVEVALRLSSALLRYWEIRGYLREGRARLEAALSLPGADAFPAAVADAANDAGVLAVRLGDMAAARGFLERALTLWRASGEERRTARALNNLAYVVSTEGDSGGAQSLYEEALALNQRFGNRASEASNRISLGLLHHNSGRYEQARAHYEAALALLADQENRYNEAIARGNLGNTLRRLGDTDGARAMYCQALSLSRAIGAHVVTLMSVGGLSALAREGGDWERAVRMTAAFEVHAAELGAVLTLGQTDRAETLRAEAIPILGAERLERLWAEGRALTLEEAAELAAG